MFEIFSIAGTFGLLAFIIGVWKLQLKPVQSIYRLDIVKSLCWIIHLALIGGISGIIVNIMAILRSGSRLYLSDKYMLPVIIITTVFTWILGLFFYVDTFSLLPLCATSIVSYGMLKQDRTLYTNCILAHYIFWIIYAISIGSTYVAMSVIAGVISCVIGKIRHEKWLGIKRPSWLSPSQSA